jgi:hypothetical protein
MTSTALIIITWFVNIHLQQVFSIMAKFYNFVYIVYLSFTRKKALIIFIPKQEHFSSCDYLHVSKHLRCILEHGLRSLKIMFGYKFSVIK